MTNWLLIFPIVGILAAVLALTGCAGLATPLAWIAFVISLLMFVMSVIMERHPPF